MVTPTTRWRDRRDEQGVALLSVILLLALTSALLVGFIVLVSSDQRSGWTNRDQTLAYGAAHAGLEQLTSRLGETFATDFNPTTAEVNALAATAPNLRDTSGQPYVTFTAPGNTPVTNDASGYRIIFTSVGGYPQAEATPRTIASGPYQGLQGRATPYTIEVTARTTAGSEVRMRRTMQTMLIPAFQFGVFSEGPLAFHSGTAFTFGGRAHTNSDMYLAAGDGTTLTLSDRVTAVGEVIRKRIPNGVLSALGWSGSVYIPNSSKTLAMTEGSVTDGLGSSLNEPRWTNAVARLNRMIINGRTGAKRLDLPLVQMGAQPVDLVRRPLTTELTTSPVYEQRYFARASLRILLSDFPEDITNLPGIASGTPVNLANLKTGGGYAWFTVAPGQAPASIVPNGTAAAYDAASGFWNTQNTALLRGYIKIEKQSPTGVWSDVTQEILSLGFTGMRLSATNAFDNAPASGSAPPCADVSPNAVIRLQRVRDDHPATMQKQDFITGAGTTAVNTPCGMLQTAFSTIPAGTPLPKGDYYWENALYDPREGAFRDSDQRGTTTLFLGGVMHYIELDVNNLVRWFTGAIGSTGSTNTENSDGGYVVYISDRRTNKSNPLVPVSGAETGEYGFEDNINLSSTAGYPGNGTLDTGEDLNDNGVLDTYGQNPYGWNTTSYPWRTSLPIPTGATQAIGNTTIRPWNLITARQARVNAPLFFRRAVKLVDGADTSGSTLRALGAGKGLTVVAENPVYVQGNYNTYTSWGTGETNHRGAAIIADTVSLLSINWNDIRSFTSPHDPAGRAAATTWYRMAVVSGKVKFFPKQAGWGADDSGADGGVHNFLRMIENWDGDTLNYKGSLISFFYSRQAVGTFKYLNPSAPIYIAPTRSFSYDTEFLQFALLPPKPPSFRDVNTLTFRQILRPNQ